MAKIYNVGKFGVVARMKVKEGNVTIGAVNSIQGNVKGPILSAPAKKGDFVKISADLTVEPCAANDTACIGRLESDPQWIEAEPTANANWGYYAPREANVEFFGTKILTVPLEAANSAISVGNSVTLGATTAQKWDKDATPNSTVALEAAQASSGAKIAVLFGAYRL